MKAQKFISLLFVSTLLVGYLLSCKKEKYIAMKTGYYDVIETKTFPDGSMETDSYIALGSYNIQPKESVYSFTSIKDHKAMSYNFNFNQESSFDYFSAYYKINYKVTDFEISPTELIVKRTEISDSLVSNIHFKYIE